MQDSPTTEPTAPKTGVRPIVVILNFVMAIACVIALIVALTHESGTSTTAGNGKNRTWEYTIDFGTGAKLDAGIDVNFFPRELDVHVGDELVIHNHDNRSHQVGPYLVDRGETLQQSFTEKGTLEGLCTIHPSGKVTIVVS